MSVSQVLGSPELLHYIFSHCQDSQASLAAAARVNSIWSEEALNVLWGSRDFGANPPIHEGRILVDIPKSRRQYYASKIRMLHIEHRADEVHAALRGLKFPKLKHLLLNQHYAAGAVGSPPSQYLQSALEGIEWFSWDSDLTKDFLDELNTQCPGLKDLTLGESDNVCVTPEEFLDFLANNRSINEITIACPDLVDDDVLVYLSGRNGLESLALWDCPWEDSVFPMIGKQRTHPFDDLRDLTLTLKSSAVAAAMPLLKNVTRVNFEIEGDGKDVPSCLATLPLLQDICIRFGDATELSVDGLLAMSSLTHLKRFCFMGHELSSSFADDNLESLMAALPRLETFNFPVQCRLSSSALLCLSKHRTRLTELTLRGAYDLQVLAEGDEPLFPELTTLVIKGDGSGELPPRRFTATDIARLICCQAPRLDDLELTDPRLQDVVEAYD